MTELTPRDIVRELDKHIVGQGAAKRAVAIALRNRWRRLKVPGTLRAEITPKNILMIGPTGVGKTEIARRLARMANAPFVKVEATKFTEVGYVGREVDSIIKDLVDASIKLTRDEERARVLPQAQAHAENRALESLLPRARATDRAPSAAELETQQRFRRMLREGELDDQEVEVEVRESPTGPMEILVPPGEDESRLLSMLRTFRSGSLQRKKLPVPEALKVLLEEEVVKLTNEVELRKRALENAEQHGIVFIDEIDKIARAGGASAAEVSREGVQRDLLPLVEGCTVSTRYGAVKTDHILFIASGAFHGAKPSDLMPELQGRFPIRVELEPLNEVDFVRILSEPDASLLKQYQALLATEGLTVVFTPDAVQALARIACEVNAQTENIGARRLHALIERLLTELSFEATDCEAREVSIDSGYVERSLGHLARNQDLSRYIL